MIRIRCPYCARLHLITKPMLGQAYSCPQTSARLQLPHKLPAHLLPGEADWESARSPALLIDLLGGKSSLRRKRLLFAALQPSSIQGNDHEADELTRMADEWRDEDRETSDLCGAFRIAGFTTRPDDPLVSTMNVWLGWYSSERLWPESLPNELDDATKCALLRELFPNPYRVVFVLEHWLRANDGAVAEVARAIYAEGRFADLPVLADALEEVGCDEPALLSHLRAPGPHVRGCWALDALLGRA